MTVRFAPSPTGNFHVGNLRTAWVSHAWARRLGMPWIVRFENIDEPRNAPGAMESQLADMAALGMVPDAMPIQSEKRERHWEAFQKMFDAGWVYPCVCSRKEIREAVEGSASAPHGPVPGYTGLCRHRKEVPVTNLPTWAWRIRSQDESGRDDFVVARTAPALAPSGGPDHASFVPAYHWACAVDDYDGDHALLVRAWDLEEAAAQQRWIHARLAELEKNAKPFPAIFHCCLVTSDDGSRLEKRTRGASLKETLDAGKDAAAVIAAFEASFNGDWDGFAAGKIFGERRKTLTMGELFPGVKTGT